MAAYLKTLFIVPALVAALLAPKLSSLVLHLHPGIMTIVICTGSEMVTLHIGADGEPVELDEASPAPCLLVNPNDIGHPAYVRWTQAPRTYRATFVEIHHDFRSQAEVGLLPALRGPPFVI